MVRASRNGAVWYGRWMTILVATGCASGAPDVAPEPDPEPTVVAPLPGENFVVYYLDETGVRHRDTRVGTDSLLIPVRGGGLVSRVSRDGGHLAMAFLRGDSATLAIVDVGTGRITAVHAGGPDVQYTFEWDPRGGQLGVGYRRAGEGGVFLVTPNGQTRDVGCSVSNQFVAWRTNGIVVSDGRNMYTVSAGNCATQATLPLQGKSGVAYSPDGDRVLFYRTASLRTTEGTVRRPELYVASFNGAGAQKIADPQFNPRRAAWSPDGRRVAFEIQSPRFANITHVAVHEVATGNVSFADQQRELGMPTDTNPCWAPAGDQLAHDRAYQRQGQGQAYLTKQKIVKTIPGNTERIVDDALIRDLSLATVETVCQWVDGSHLVAEGPDGPNIVNTTTSESYLVTGARTVLAARVF